jgi:hypothetical protein
MTLKDLLSDLQNHREALLDRCGDAGGHLRGGVPVEQFNPLAAFDGSVIVERTAGEVSARCHLPPLCDKRPPEGWPVTRSDPLQLSVLPSRPACGRPPAAAVLGRQHHDRTDAPDHGIFPSGARSQESAQVTDQVIREILGEPLERLSPAADDELRHPDYVLEMPQPGGRIQAANARRGPTSAGPLVMLGFARLWTGHAKLVDARRDLAWIELAIAVGISPGHVREREDGNPPDHLTIGAVERSPILLSLGKHELTA